MRRLIVLGIVCAVGSSFPLAAMTALVYGFPVPFAGHLRGPGALVPSLIAVMVYGTLTGGFVVLAAAGTLSALVGGKLFPLETDNAKLVTAVLSILASALGVMVLATLHLIIGPW